MQSVNHLVLIFMIYSFIGWVCECIVCSLEEKKFINRGFLNGPICPIYGVGGLLVISILTPFAHNIILLFITATILTTTLEYFTGLVLEKIFHTTWWDYSKNKFNFQGRICLLNSLAFGLMSVIGVKYLHPFIVQKINAIPPMAVFIFSVAFLVFFIFDIIISVYTILQLNGKLDQLQQIMDEIKEKSAAFKDDLIEKGTAVKSGIMESGAAVKAVDSIKYLRSKIETLRDDDTKNQLNVLFDKQEKMELENKPLQRRLIKAFPAMKSTKYNESLNRIKDAVLGHNKKK